MTLARAISGTLLSTTLLACGADDGASDGAGSTTDPTTTAAPPTTTGGAPGTTTGETSAGDETTAAPDTTAATTTAGPTSTTTVTSADTTSSDTASSGEPSGSACAGSTLALCVDFESAVDGGFPDGWGARGDEWGEGTLGVASDDAVLGARALKADGGNNGQHFMDYKGDLGALATHHYGRVFIKVATPAPWPADGVLHADFIEGLGPGPGGSTHNVRWGVVENTAMAMQWIFNVQPSNGDPEFGEGTAYDYTWTGAWQCVEWFYDQPSQQGGLWIDGVQLPIVPGANHAAEIPVFSSLGVGLANYQPAGAGFTVWFDELAYDAERIGCEL